MPSGDPVAIFTKIYPFIEKMPKTAPIFDVLRKRTLIVSCSRNSMLCREGLTYTGNHSKARCHERTASANLGRIRPGFFP